VTTTIIIRPTPSRKASPSSLPPIRRHPPHLRSLSFANHSFDLDAYLGQQLLPLCLFRADQRQHRYTDEDIAASRSRACCSTTGPARPGPTGHHLLAASTYSRDPALNRIAVSICHLTEWNIQGPDSMRIIYLPLIVKKLDPGARPGGRADRRCRRRHTGGGQEPGNAPVLDEFWWTSMSTPTRLRLASTRPGTSSATRAGVGCQRQGAAPGARRGDYPDGRRRLLLAEYSNVAWPLPPARRSMPRWTRPARGHMAGAGGSRDPREPYNNIAGPVHPGPGGAGSRLPWLRLPAGRAYRQGKKNLPQAGMADLTKL